MNGQSELNLLDLNINSLKEKVLDLQKELEGFNNDIDVVRESMWECQQKRSEIVNTEYSNQTTKGKDIAEMNEEKVFEVVEEAPKTFETQEPKLKLTAVQGQKSSILKFKYHIKIN